MSILVVCSFGNGKCRALSENQIGFFLNFYGIVVIRKGIYTRSAFQLFFQNIVMAGYQVCSGLSTKGKYACPICVDQLPTHKSEHLKKMVYPSFRQFLPMDHVWRGTQYAANFNGEVNHDPIPGRKSGMWWIDRWNEQGAHNSGMKRLSIFYRLPILEGKYYARIS
jgi:hypothetical protein